MRSNYTFQGPAYMYNVTVNNKQTI